MESPRKPRRKGCLFGCGLTALALILAIIALSFGVLRPVRQAKQIEQTLNEMLLPALEFVPAADGVIPAERLEIFLQVRRNLYERTPDLIGDMEQFQTMDRVAQDPGATNSQVVGELFRSFKSAALFSRKFLEYQTIRNESLLAAKMGLGEYFYIYVLAYHDQLSTIAQNKGECALDKRTVKEVTQILRNQRQAGAAAMDHDNALSADLEEQIISLESGTCCLPWEKGLPPQVTMSLASFRDRLDAVFCADTVFLDLKQKNRNFAGIGD